MLGGMSSRLEGITFTDSADGLDWAEAKADLAADDFDNGRTPEQLARSFQNSFTAAYAFDERRCVGMARLLADGVCNAYLIDVWTHSPYRGRGIASEMIRRLLATVPGHHVLLITENASGLYRKLGFVDEQQAALSLVVGEWLKPA
jgi:ribosomal protein S18 acetylase RimI-like enzyme